MRVLRSRGINLSGAEGDWVVVTISNKDDGTPVVKVYGPYDKGEANKLKTELAGPEVLTFTRRVLELK